MKFSVMERVLLGAMMAQYKGSFTNLKILREGREIVSFNDEENQKLKFVADGKTGSLSWNPEASLTMQAVEINFDVTVTNVIKGILQKMNDAEELSEQHFSLCEKFLQ